MCEHLIEICDLRVAFKGQEVVHGIDLDIRPANVWRWWGSPVPASR